MDRCLPSLPLSLWLLGNAAGGRVPERCTNARILTRKLDLLHYAHKIDDLRSPPANRLEALKGDFHGFFSIRVNDQWRIIFRWTSSGPEDVDVVDYHG